MRSYFLALAVMSTQIAFAQKGPTTTPSPFGDLQTQLDALAARVETLERNAPNSSVEGRTYCMVVNALSLIGNAIGATEVVDSGVVRRTATFAGGTLTATLVSSTFHRQSDDGVVSSFVGMAPEPLLATYTQTGNKLDVVLADGGIANWYVSRDGSVVFASAIDLLGPLPSSATIGLARWTTMVENDTCDMENQ
jgi:hypothetical protein